MKKNSNSSLASSSNALFHNNQEVKSKIDALYKKWSVAEYGELTDGFLKAMLKDANISDSDSHVQYLKSLFQQKTNEEKALIDRQVPDLQAANRQY